jgi:lipid A disaccharide synthetase
MVKLGKRYFQELPYYTFPNLLARREIVPEFVQSRFTLENLYVECTELLDDPALAGHMRAEMSEVRRLTMGDDPIGTASKELIKLIKR